MKTDHIKQGKRADLDNRYYRSAWEANYARYLNFLLKHKQIFKWEYEPDTFWFDKIKRGTRHYTPDFKVWETEESKPKYVEIKGYMDATSKTKLKRMAKYYPDVNIIICGRAEYYILQRQVAAMIDGWESG
jgi:hypothetical protein